MGSNRINKEMVAELFKELDQALGSKGQNREITIFGSGAMMAQGLLRPNRYTVDIDMARPNIDMDLQIISADVGEKYKLDITWLNSAGVIFSRNFPSGWESRKVMIYEGKSLTVHSLGRKDLIATKFNAFCNRNAPYDGEDLADMNPSVAELKFAKEWVLSQNDMTSDLIKLVDKKSREVLSYGSGRSR